MLKPRFLYLVLFLSVLFFVESGFSPVYSMNSSDFDSLTIEKKRKIIESALRSWMNSLENIDIQFEIEVSTASFESCFVTSPGSVTSKYEYELKRIKDNNWIHYQWYVAEDGKFQDVPDVHSYFAYDADSGEARTYSALKSAPQSFTGFILADNFSEWRLAHYPELLGFSCRCESWETPNYLLNNIQNTEFLTCPKLNGQSTPTQW